MYIILSLFSPIIALVHRIPEPSLAHLPLPVWRSTTALFVTHHPASQPLESTPKELRLPTDHEYLSLSSDSHVSSSFPSSPLSPSITPSQFHSRLKTHLFHKFFYSVVLHFHSLDWLHGLQLFFVFLRRVGFNFGIVC